MTDPLYKRIPFALIGAAAGIFLALLLNFGASSLDHRRIIK
jgi:hypothetical protein